MKAGVRLTVVSAQNAADTICSLLRANGIESSLRSTDSTSREWREIFIADKDLETALELVANYYTRPDR